MVIRRKAAARDFILGVLVLAVLILGGCLAYGRYSSPQDWPPFSFDPPQGWGVSQGGPSKYDPRRSVFFLGPANEANTLKASMGIAFFRPDEPGAPYKSPDELRAQIEGGINESDERIRQDGTITIDGISAREVIFDGFYYPPTHSVPRAEDRVADTEWFVVMWKDRYVFQLDYIAARGDFQTHAPLFEKMLATFRFHR